MRLVAAKRSRHAAAAAFFLLFLSIVALGQKELSIAAVQGNKNMTPFDGQSVQVSGIVTARTRTGFFIQTPDDKADGNPNTSEGIFVFTRTEPGGEAAPGNLVAVIGTVEEFRPRSEPNTLSLTEITMQRDRDAIRVISRSNPLPKPIAIKLEDFKSNQIDQLERFEGMRVAVEEMSVVSPTGGRVDIKSGTSESNGTFYGVLKGVLRPFREPGLEFRHVIFHDGKTREKFKTDYPKLPLFDGNPERLRVESAAQTGSQAMNVPAFAAIKNLSGVLHYSFNTYTIFVDADSRPAVTTSTKPSPLIPTTERQFAVASMNIENFFDDRDDPDVREEIVAADAFQNRLKKISSAVREFMRLPEVIGIVEAENVSTLKRLAERINADAVAAGLPDPKYDAHLVEGNDGRGIDNGFLVKTSRVKVVEVKQFGKEEKYKNPNTKDDELLNDRPPLLLRASINDAKFGQPFEFTVIVSHLKSYLGYDDPKQQENVRLKKRLQAEYLARLAQDRQKAGERVMLIGDFNSYQFSDGVLDMIGTIKGRPAGRHEVVNASPDLVDPDLANLVDSIDPRQRYSYLFDGNAQVLDHVIINEPLKKHAVGFGYARLNADWPEIYRNDASRPERFSDHDPAVAYFTLDASSARP